MTNKNKLPQKLKPFYTKNLLRLGTLRDGGYIINQEILDKSKTLLTFGLFEEFTFEEDYFKMKPKNRIIVYDHSVNKIFWIKNALKWFFHFIHNQKNFLKIFGYFSYRKLFKKENVNHYKLRVREHAQKNTNSISIKEIILKNNIIPKETILKIDIDMDEYRLLEDILEFDFMSIVFEFHHTDLLMDKILKFLENSKYKIIHIHGNNFDYPDKNGNPIYLEITLANTDYIEVSNNYIDYKLPVEKLDFPNDIKRDEIPIIFSSDS